MPERSRDRPMPGPGNPGFFLANNHARVKRARVAALAADFSRVKDEDEKSERHDWRVGALARATRSSLAIESVIRAMEDLANLQSAR